MVIYKRLTGKLKNYGAFLSLSLFLIYTANVRSEIYAVLELWNYEWIEKNSKTDVEIMQRTQ